MRNFLSFLRGGRLVVAIIIGVALVLSVGRAFAGAYVEILWQMQAGYSTVFWKRVIWEWGSRTTVGVTVALLVLVNLKIASATLGGIQIRRRFEATPGWFTKAKNAIQGVSEETDLARAQQELTEARARYRAAQKLKGKR